MSTARELQEQGVQLYSRQEYEAAARIFQQAVEAYQAEGQADMAAEMQTNVGLVHRALGEYQQALDVMQQALRVFQEQGDDFRAAQVTGNIGGVYYELNDKEQAYHCYRQAADTFRDLGQNNLYGETLVALAKLQFRDGKFTTGATTFEVGIEFLEHPTRRQKIIRRLIGMRKKITGS